MDNHMQGREDPCSYPAGVENRGGYTGHSGLQSGYLIGCLAGKYGFGVKSIYYSSSKLRYNRLNISSALFLKSSIG